MGNKYSSEQNCVIAISSTATSRAELTSDIANRKWFPALDINEDRKSDLVSVNVVDDFRGHHAALVKKKTVRMKNIFKFEIMAGGITQKAQPLDLLVNKVFVGYFCDYLKNGP
jgi:hypothetical protein